MFEVFSAFGTVGLSTGITPQLTSAGKWIIMLTMLVGRIGPLTLVLASGQRAERVGYDYPEEHVMIG
jgi:trk system potassium uptake protein TrkH